MSDQPGPTPAPEPPTTPAAIVDLRRPGVAQETVAPRPWRWLLGPLLCVVLPTALVAGYLTVVASPRYQAEATAGLRSTAPQAAPGLTFTPMGLTFGSGDSDSLLLVAYLRSQQLVEALDQELGLRRHWADPGHDPLFRLSASASREELIACFLRRTAVAYDQGNGLLTVSAQGYDPEFAQRLVGAMLARAEQAVNRFGQELVAERVRAFADEVARTARAQADATAELVAFQAKHRLLDARGQAQAVTELLLGFEADIARTRTTLGELTAVRGEAADEVVRHRARLAALERERQLLLVRMVGPEAATDPDAANRLAARQNGLELTLQQATATHQAALAARDQALTQASHKLKQLIVIDPPRRPEEATHPRALYWTATCLALLGLLYAIGRMVVVTIREHRD